MPKPKAPDIIPIGELTSEFIKNLLDQTPSAATPALTEMQVAWNEAQAKAKAKS